MVSTPVSIVLAAILTTSKVKKYYKNKENKPGKSNKVSNVSKLCFNVQDLAVHITFSLILKQIKKKKKNSV